MNFLFGAIILDCIANGNKETSEEGAGLLTSLALLIYIIFKLPQIEHYILNACIEKTNLLIWIIMGFAILIPIYWSHFNKYKSLIINMLLRIMIYIDIFCGIAIMVTIKNELGFHMVSFIFNIDKVSVAAHSDKFFLSLFSSLWYLIIKILDFICAIGLVPLIQFIFYILFNKIRKILK